MLGALQNLLKKNRVTRSIAQRTRSFFSPLHHLQDLRDAWNREFYEGDDIARCFSLFEKNRDYQAKLASIHVPRAAASTRYLDAEWVSNIGTLANLDGYAKIGLLGWRPPQQAFLTAYPGAIGNAFFLGLWKNYFSVLDDPAVLRQRAKQIPLLLDHNLVMELRNKLYIFPHAAAVVQREWENQKRQPLLQLDEQTKQLGWDRLAEAGIPHGSWFVAVHVRENGFKTEEHRRCVRNANIATYLPAMRKITAHGGWVIRCGHPTMSPLPKMDRVLDYAYSPIRCDWLDIFLASQCRFLIGTQSGLSHVGDVFGVPTLYTNWISWGFPPYYNTNVFVPKMLWSREECRTLTLREIVPSQLGWCQNPDVFAARGIDILNNTPEDLEAAVVQMLNETETAWDHARKQAPLQQAFAEWDVLLNSRVSDAFLSKLQSR